MTSGYHQMPMDPSSSWMTAFKTFMGVYQWDRVPMGVKPAANFFQKTMATEVLMELLFQVCEVYIDDILVFGKTEDEYVNNLEKILKRFVEKGITLNPDKCVFGKESVNFVGFVIERATFDQTKLDSVVDFIKPNN